MLKQARLNPTANGLLGLKQTQRGIPVRAKSNPSVTARDKKWFGSAPKSEDAKEKEEKHSQSSGSLSSGSSGEDEKAQISEDCRSESAFILRPPPGPKLKRRLAKPRPDEIILVDEYDDNEAFNVDDGEIENTEGENNGVGTSTGSNRLTEVLQLQAVCGSSCGDGGLLIVVMSFLLSFMSSFYKLS